MPPELNGWNWGAFFLNWVWGLAHNTWIALLMFVPGINFVMPFVLGAKGNQWAWENNDWRDIEHFKRTQRIWARVGVGAFFGVPAFFGAIIATLMIVLNTSDPYRISVDYMRDHPALEHSLGLPVEPSGWLTTGDIRLRNSEGYADLSFDVAGPRDAATAFVYMELSNGVWEMIQLYVVTERGEEIDLTGAGREPK